MVKRSPSENYASNVGFEFESVIYKGEEVGWREQVAEAATQ